MKRKSNIAAVLALSLGIILHAGSAIAFDNSEKISRYWDKHESAKSEIINAWARDASQEEYARAIYKIGKTETFLLASGVRPDDSRFVSGLASGGQKLRSRYDFSILAYRIFKHELNLLVGFTPDPRRLFEGSFTIENK